MGSQWRESGFVPLGLGVRGPCTPGAQKRGISTPRTKTCGVPTLWVGGPGLGHPFLWIQSRSGARAARLFKPLGIRGERPVCPQVSVPRFPRFLSPGFPGFCPQVSQVSVPRFPQVSVPRFPQVSQVSRFLGFSAWTGDLAATGDTRAPALLWGCLGKWVPCPLFSVPLLKEIWNLTFARDFN
jgi:hypothetical protein